MKAIALGCLNNVADSGTKRTRDGWHNWLTKRLTARDRQIGFVAVVSLFHSDNHGSYYRLNVACTTSNENQ